MDAFISLILLDAMLGPDFGEAKIRMEKLKNLENGLYDDLYITVDIPSIQDENKFPSLEEYFASIPQLLPKQGTPAVNANKLNDKYTGKLTDARGVLQSAFLHHLSEKIDVKKKAISDIETEGIIFIDEIDKIVISSVESFH